MSLLLTLNRCRTTFSILSYNFEYVFARRCGYCGFKIGLGQSKYDQTIVKVVSLLDRVSFGLFHVPCSRAFRVFVYHVIEPHLALYFTSLWELLFEITQNFKFYQKLELNSLHESLEASSGKMKTLSVGNFGSASFQLELFWNIFDQKNYVLLLSVRSLKTKKKSFIVYS